MDNLNSKLNVIDKIIKKCEQSSLETFTYQDAMFFIQFNKVKADCSTNKSQKNNIENVSELKTDYMENEFDEYAFTDVSQIDTQEKEDMITVVSPFVGTVEFSNQIKLGSNEIYVKEGDVICSVEAMKIYNDIKSPASGTIVEILVKDSKLVEYEQPILKIRVDKNES